MKNMMLGCRFVSFLMLLLLTFHWKIVVVPFQFVLQNPNIFNESKSLLIYFIVTGALCLMLNLIAAVGLFSVKKWGFRVSYLAIIASTLAGVSYLPLNYKLFYRFFLQQPSIIPMIMINAVVLSYVIYLDISHSKIKK
jgi:uncharacterized membrane protein (DUF2068 family)